MSRVAPPRRDILPPAPTPKMRHPVDGSPIVGGTFRMGETPGCQWHAAADELAAWTSKYLVNRTDCFGRYLPDRLREGNRSKSYTAPKKEQRFDGALSEEIIAQHYRGEDHGHLVGLHAISKDNTSRWLVIDVDKHGENDPASPQANAGAMKSWGIKLRLEGFHPLLMDSNGDGGYHLLVVFNEPAPSNRVYDFGHWIVRDHVKRGLFHEPEIFPKQPNVNPNRPYGSWCRLPGRHHTRDHWTRVWVDGQWLEGRPAIDAIVATSGDSPSLIPEGVANESVAGTTTGASNIATVSTAGQQRQGRVGVAPNPQTPRYTSPDAEFWLGVLKGRGPGGRHEATLQLAGHLLGKRIDPRVVEELCVLWNALRNNPPKDDDVIRATVQDLAQRDATAAPRSTTTTLRLSQ